MNAIDFGSYLLDAALLTAIVAALLSLAAARFGQVRLLTAAKAVLGLVALLLTASSAALFVLLLKSDFAVDYVTRYTERALPTGYKIAAFWAGQEGSLLLWAWMLAVMSMIAIVSMRATMGDAGDHLENTLHAGAKRRAIAWIAPMRQGRAAPDSRGAAEPEGGHEHHRGPDSRSAAEGAAAQESYRAPEIRGGAASSSFSKQRQGAPLCPGVEEAWQTRDVSQLFLQNAIAAAILAVVVAFFIALIVCTANPFARGPAVEDGQGLNPMLQNFGMIAHPPILFLGYAASTIPFAFMIGALIAKRPDAWALDIRRWSLAAWLFLSVGILLGAQWAYVELGWGGYWAWDPVENASLLPWLTATGLLHSIISQQRRGMFRGWTAGLVAATFILCIFGTYLTRSGVVQSVHAFHASQVGTFFLAFLCAVVVGSVVVFVSRRKQLLPSNHLQGWLNRELAVLAGNVLLAAMTLITLFGTVFPLISGAVATEPLSVSAGYYNKGVLPLGLCLVAIMAIGPALDAGKIAAPALRRLRWPALAAIIAPALVSLICHGVSLWTIAVSAACAGAVACFIAETLHAWRGRMHHLGENAPVALLRLIDANHRRYGGQTVHMGIAMIVAGIAGSSLAGIRQDFQLHPGQSASFAGGSLKFEDLRQITIDNYEAVEASLIFTEASGHQTSFHPQRRFYNHREDSSSEVAIQSSLSKDLYMTLAGWETGGEVVSFQAFVNPLVNWIWIGGAVITLGAVICLLPKLEPTRRVVKATTVEPAANELEHLSGRWRARHV